MNMGIRNIHLDGSSHARNLALCCETDEARFHIWIDRITLKPAEDWIYKNPPLDKRDAFTTRTLRMDRGIGKQIVPMMIEKIDQALIELESKNEAERKRIEADHLAVRKDAAIKRAAHDMLAALELIAGSDRFNGGTFVKELQHIARDAIKKIEVVE